MSGEGLAKLKSGEFNHMIQDWQTDGSVIITLSRTGKKEKYRFKVKDLYRPTEQLISEEVIQE